MYIDTHCHLSTEDYDDIELILKGNFDNDITKMIISGCTKNSIVESLNYCNKYNNLYLTCGFHPSEASIVNGDDLMFLEDIIKNENKVVGIGEIGLDYHYGKDDVAEQKKLFREQMKMAEKFKLPVVIHSRDATEDTIKIIKEFPLVKGVIHCFSGSVETANIYINNGYKLGIGGVVTFKNSNLFKVVDSVGIKNIVLETDSPYLTPVPFRGQKNSSKYIPYIASKVSDILNISIENVAKITTENAICLFDLNK